MSPMRWQKILNNVMVCSLPVMVNFMPVGPDGQKHHGILLNGCCAGFKETYRSAIHIELPVSLARPVSYEKCLELCQAALQTDKNRSNADNIVIESCSELIRPNNSKNVLQCKYVEHYYCVGGRLPAGLQPQEAISAASELGAYFGQLAFLEEAAVAAFQHLAQELEAHQAPSFLIEGAYQGAEEEKEHAAMTKLLAAMYGAQPPNVEMEPFQVRPLEALAMDNAVEGCVRETYAALLGQWQGMTSTSPEVRPVMSRIGEEETGHAALSWAIDEWISPRLSPDQRQQKQDVQREAIAQLKQEAQKEPSPTMRTIAGFPTVAQSQVMLEQLEQHVWSLS